MKNVFAIAFLVALSMLPIQMAVGNDLPTNNHLRTVLRPLHDPDYRIQGDNISDYLNSLGAGFLTLSPTGHLLMSRPGRLAIDWLLYQSGQAPYLAGTFADRINDIMAKRNPNYNVFDEPEIKDAIKSAGATEFDEGSDVFCYVRGGIDKNEWSDVGSHIQYGERRLELLLHDHLAEFRLSKPITAMFGALIDPLIIVIAFIFINKRKRFNLLIKSIISHSKKQDIVQP